jgi:biotin carboxyl carrier protein
MKKVSDPQNCFKGFQKLEEVDEARILAIKGEKTYEILFESVGNGRADIQVSGKPISIAFDDSRNSRQSLRTKGAPSDGKVIASVMPGKVVKVFAKVGDRVEKGTPLIIVEAMKMENELKAPSSGVVKKVNVSEGKSIEANVPLIIIG